MAVDVTVDVRRRLASCLDARLIEQLSAGIVVTDDAGIIMYRNVEAGRLLRHDPRFAIGQRLGQVRPAYRFDARSSADRCELHSPDEIWRGAVDFDGHDGSLVSLFTSVSRLELPEIGVAGRVYLFVDDTGRRRFERELAERAFTDPLTGVANRAGLDEYLTSALGSGDAAAPELVAVCFIDLDSFKEINDHHGHHVGDEVLRTVARRLESCVRSSDVVARISGDEFVICLSGSDLSVTPEVVAERVLGVLADPIVVEGVSLNVSASVGVTVADGDEPGDLLLREADAAMYRAKLGGKGRVEVYGDDLRREIRSNRALLSGLQDAMRNDDLVVVYQPQASLCDGVITGVEALVRWRRDGRLIGPDAFIPHAERSGLIGELGQRVLEIAAATAARLRAGHPEPAPRMSVNVSAGQLAQACFPEVVEQVLVDAGIPPELLCIEITETVLVSDIDELASSIKRVRALGVRLAIDDFGTGYSSLRYLQTFNVHELKIDRSFTEDLPHRHHAVQIVRAVVSLAHELEIDVVAEGVENRAQESFLRDIGCDTAQGYGISPPLREPQLFDWLRRRRLDQPESGCLSR